jgi:hypothetical protein
MPPLDFAQYERKHLLYCYETTKIIKGEQQKQILIRAEMSAIKVFAKRNIRGNNAPVSRVATQDDEEG